MYRFYKKKYALPADLWNSTRVSTLRVCLPPSSAAQNDSERQMTIVLYHGQMTVVALADAVGEIAAALQPCDGSYTVADCEKRPDR